MQGTCPAAIKLVLRYLKLPTSIYIGHMSISRTGGTVDNIEELLEETDYGDVEVQWLFTERLGLSDASAQVTQHDPLEGRLDADEIAIMIGWNTEHGVGMQVGDSAEQLSSESEWGFNIGDNATSMGADNPISDETFDSGGFAGDRMEKRVMFSSTVKAASGSSPTTIRESEWYGGNAAGPLRLGPVLTSEDFLYQRTNPNAGSDNGIVTLSTKIYWEVVEIESAVPQFGFPDLKTV